MLGTGKIAPMSLIMYHRSWWGKAECNFTRKWLEIAFNKFKGKFDQTLPTRDDFIVYKPKPSLDFLANHLYIGTMKLFAKVC